MRKIAVYTILSFAALSSTLFGSPTLGYIYNTAGYVPPGLPGYGIAQGSFFVLYGANMAPASLASASSTPLPTTGGLGGAVATVTVNGTTLTAPLWYTSAGQIGGVMPSTTPVGTGTITVTYNGASGSLPVTVVPSAFGIFTFNTIGSGEAVVSFANFTAVTTNNSAMPNQTVILWGTGLGANAGSDANAPTQVNLNTPLTLYVGNIAVTPLYTGRSAFPGVDQVNFTIPAGLSGCNVSLVAQTTTSTGSIVSNSTTIPVAPNGGTCSDSDADISQTLFNTFGAKASVNVGYISLSQQNSGLLNNGQLFVSSSAKAQSGFLQITQAQLPTLAAATFNPSVGSCVIAITTGANAGNGTNVSGTYLDAGTSLTLTPPSGAAITLSGGASKQYSGTPSSVVPGVWTLSNGSGGANVGPFSLMFTVPQQITWTNETAIGTIQGTNPVGPTINRSQPLNITWTGGDSNGYVGISVDAGFTNTSLPVDVNATCIAPTSAGSFTIPTNVLLAMPNTQQQFGYGSISVGTGANAQSLNISGLDGAIALSSTSSNIGVIFQ